MTDFSVLMPVYSGDNVDFVQAAYASATVEQELPPTQVVIVRDGPVPEAMEAWLTGVEDEPHVSVVRLDANGGLAAALNAGLAHVTTDVVARVDADDICLPRRFAIQIPMMETGLDIVGSAIAEFSTDPTRPERVRSIPITQSDIEKQARLMCPFYHPSVVFRTQAVRKAGGYPTLNRLEDYLLWAIMLMRGAKVANAPDVLVHYRVGSGAFARRGGRILNRSEAQLQKAFLAMGFTTRSQYIRNRIMRGPVYRLMPTGLRRLGYSLWQSLFRGMK